MLVAVVPVGQSGELCTLGYSVMHGYWDDAAKTADAVEAAECWEVALEHKAGPVSLVVPYDVHAMRSATAVQRPHLRGHLVRFSMGFEAVADLQADLLQAMRSALG